MKWFGPAVKVEQFEDGDRLRFRVTSERRLWVLVLFLMLAVGMLYVWRSASWLLLLGVVALISFPLWNWFRVHITELRVTELDLVTEGDLEKGTGMIWLSWSEVSSLQFRFGQSLMHEPNGLYALKGLDQPICLVPHVNNAQAGEMIHAIYSRFPYVAVAEASETASPN